MRLSTWISKKTMRQINTQLKAAGYPTQSEGQYVCNLIDHLAGASPDARREVTSIIKSVLDSAE